MRKTTSGFTIVELLIVIVVIAILAAITIVAYNGIQSRGKTASARSTTSNTVKKAELYKTEIGNYPLGLSGLTGAPSTAVYSLTGVVYVGNQTNDTPTNAVVYMVCGTGSPANINAITTSNVSGGMVYYRDYSASTNAVITYGNYNGTGVNCHGGPQILGAARFVTAYVMYNRTMRKTTSGFTIVELLIVIVVIAILAAITIVAYNGIQARAKNSAAQSAATTVAKKAEHYNTEVGYYPLGMSALTGAASTASYNLTGIVYLGTITNTAPTNSVSFYACGSGNPADATAITSSNVTGGRIYYRDYQNSTNLNAAYGVVSGTGIVCHGRN